MNTIDIIYKYFPKNTLSELQIHQFEQLFSLYKEWNDKINVISRKDMENFYIHHVLHSLAIAKFTNFEKGTQILDLGTGGGFPSIPLAILFAEVDFLLVDSVHKKLLVINAVKDALGLKNINTKHSRAEDIHLKFDFILSRAVAKIDVLESWAKKNIAKNSHNNIKNGFILLKGGDLDTELLNSSLNYTVKPITAYFSEDFFTEKKIIHLS